MMKRLDTIRFDIMTKYRMAEKEISLFECVSPITLSALKKSIWRFDDCIKHCISCSSPFYDDVVNESKTFVKKYNGMSALSNVMLNEKLGFENPFDSIDDITPVHAQKRRGASVPKFNGVKILNISAWNSDTDNKVVYNNGVVRAGDYFHRGDIIEKSPVKIIHNEDLYSNAIRDIAFPINAEQGIYGIPFGYAAWYRDSETTGNEPNVDYECGILNDDEGYITIYATKNIRRGNEIILDSHDVSDDFHYSSERMPDRSERILTNSFKIN